MKPHGYIQVTVIFEQEKDRRWTAECRELGTATFGNSLHEVREFIEEAIELQLNSLERNGQIKRFFKENGITIINEPPPKNVQIDAPINSHIFVQPFIHSMPLAYAGAC